MFCFLILVHGQNGIWAGPKVMNNKMQYQTSSQKTSLTMALPEKLMRTILKQTNCSPE